MLAILLFERSRRLLGLGGERRDEKHRTRASEERATVYQLVLSQAVCESSAMGCGAWCNRVESNQEPSFQAGRESRRVRASPISLRRGIPTTPHAARWIVFT